MRHRKPPKPIHYDNAAAGYCRFCGEIILTDKGRHNRRANWHKPCVAAYKRIYWPRETRKAVFKRDGGICCDCGLVCDNKSEPWEVDHIRPLYEANGDIDFWKMPNLATRCLDCHKQKSAREAAQRAAARKLKT